MEQSATPFEGFVLSPQQDRAWRLAERFPSWHFHAELHLLVKGGKESALRVALEMLSERYEVLRTAVRMLPGTHLPVQEVHPPGTSGSGVVLHLVNVDSAQHLWDLPLDDELAGGFTGAESRVLALRLSEGSWALRWLLSPLVVDRVSMELLADELARLLAGEELDEEYYQYADLAAWQQEMLEGEGEDGPEAWDPPAGSLVDRLDLASLRGGGAAPGPWEMLTDTLAPALVESLETQARGLGVGLEALLLASWAGLLARHTGETRQLVGVLASGRRIEGLEGAMGPLSRVLPVEVNANVDLAELVSDARRRLDEARDEQELFCWPPERGDASGARCHFPFTFAFHQGRQTFRRGTVQVTMVASPLTEEPARLHLELRPGTEGLSWWLLYDAGALSPQAASHLGESWETWIRGIAETPHSGIPLAALPHLGAAEELHLLETLQQPETAIASAPEHFLPRFRRAVASSPEAEALRWWRDGDGDGESWSYGRLYRAALQGAAELRSRGVVRGELVLLRAHRSPHMVVGLLAALEAGAAYFPVDPQQPFGRLRGLLERARVRFVLSDLDDANDWSSGALEVLPLKAWTELSETAEEPSATALTTHSRDLAYLIATSGSTGEPKGVMVDHGGLAHYLRWSVERYGLTPGSAVVVHSSIGFDLTVTALLAPLAAGGCVHLLAEEPAVTALGERLQEDGPWALVKLTPAHLRVLSSLLDPQHMAGRVGTLVIGGEELSWHALAPWREHAPETRLINEYGPTEAVVGCSVYQVPTGARPQDGATVPIGRPVAGVCLYVLGSDLRLRAEGHPGELCIGGSMLARGYLASPALTATRFRPDPFATTSGARLYRTGDGACWNDDGELEFLGRLDEQIKLHGYRIEPGEIQAVMAAHEAVGDALVELGEVGGEPVLVAYYLGPEQAADELRQSLRERLPEYMVPPHLVALDTWPLTANGKVDRSALPRPRTELQGRSSYVAPRNAVEESLALIWAEVLDLDRVGMEDHFFQLGGDSILSITVLNKAREQGFELSPRDFFQYPTLGALAAHAMAGQGGEVWRSTEAFQLVVAQDRCRLPDDAEDAYPLSRLQAGMLFQSRLGAEDATYHDISSFRLRGELVPRALRSSLRLLLERHAVLRTSFHVTGFTQPLQVVQRSVQVPLRIEDLRHLSDDEQQRALEDWIEAEKHAGFSWHRAPLLRVQAHVLGVSRFQLSLSYHHAVVDGWSVATLLTELLDHYEALRAERTHELPPLEVTYRDFIALEREVVADEETRTYWRRELEGAAALPLPHLPAMGASEAATSEPIRVSPGPKVGAGLVAAASRHRVPLKSLLLAAHVEVLGAALKTEDVVTGLVTHGRPELPGAESLVGLFLNSVPVRVRREPGSWLDLVRSLFHKEREFTPHRRFPLADLTQELGGEVPFETLFNYVHFHIYQGGEAGSGKADGSRRTLELEEARFFEETELPFSANFTRRGNEVYLALHWNGERLPRSFVERLGAAYGEALEAIAEDARNERGPLRALFPEELQQRLLGSWSRGIQEIPGPQQLLPSESVARWASERPESPAVVDGRAVTSYGELHRRAAELAASLEHLGVTPGDVVVAMLPRGLDLVTTFVATQWLGATYAPVDPTYPRERRLHVIRDSSPAVVVTRVASLEDLDALDDADFAQVLMDHWQPSLEEVPGPAAPAALISQPDQLPAYLIFTSGSTGRPKGALLPRRGLAHLGAAQRQAFDVEGSSRCLLFASPGFDASVFEMSMALTAGACLYVIGMSQALPGRALGEWLRERRVTHATMPPTLLNVLDPEGLDHLSVVVSAGEDLPVATARRWAVGRRLINAYGPTETTVCASWGDVEARLGRPSLGRALGNLRVFVLDSQLQLCPPGVPGVLHVAGEGVGLGYLHRPGRTASAFVPNPYGEVAGDRLYATGDRVVFDDEGRLYFVDRADRQVKIRGHRVELGEVEAKLGERDGVEQCSVLAVREADATVLVAFVVADEDEISLRSALRQQLPAAAVPQRFVHLEALPLTSHGKVDRRALARRAAVAPLSSPRSVTQVSAAAAEDLEKAVGAAWEQALEVSSVGRDVNFFDLGGHSLSLLRVHGELERLAEAEIPMMELFEHPTVADQARLVVRYLGGARESVSSAVDPLVFEGRRVRPQRGTHEAVAIIGCSGRLPKARTLQDFWNLLVAGREGIRTFSREELLESGLPASVIEDPDFVPARAVLDDVDRFDAGFFGYTPREAEVMDPQQRLFLECAYSALENAGYAPGPEAGAIGVFAGESANSYLFNLLSNRRILESVGPFAATTANDKDFLATRVAYKLGLEGPALSVQTACSTSLVAVHLACRSVLEGECDMALAGGVSVRLPQVGGHRWVEGGIDSPDGHCRPFDADAQGTVSGNGVALVVLKRLSDALADGDTIRAVIRGSAINNDGSRKVGFTAPRIESQARVVRSALEAAELSATDLDYVEAHGTGTALGDPMEVAALTQAFRADTDESGFCGLGSVKSNIGHLDAAAGVTGLLKVVLALEHETLPASLHFENPNPKIDFEASPFRVVAKARPWPREERPRRAGVSSFGIGGTNAHVVIEEAPSRREPAASGQPQRSEALVLSAHSEEALRRMAADLSRHLTLHPDTDLGAAAHTLQVGRWQLPHRMVAVAASTGQAAAMLAGDDGAAPLIGRAASGPSVAFLFPGQGSQHPGMAADVHDAFPTFRQRLEELLGSLPADLAGTLRPLLLDPAADADLLRQTRYAQPVLFLLELTLAELWMSWGVRPAAVAGHSVGEITAAAVAGVMDPVKALALVVKRGEWMHACEGGEMISVDLPRAEASARAAAADLELAAVNAATSCVLSGPAAAVRRLGRELEKEGVGHRVLHTSHAFHSRAMAPVVEPFAEAVAALSPTPPRLPMFSGGSGTWLRDDEATDPRFWARQLVEPVLFAGVLGTLALEAQKDLLEVGPGNGLTQLVGRIGGRNRARLALPSLPHPRSRTGAVETLLKAVGRLWISGAAIRWQALHETSRHRRIPLPGYAFTPERHWVEGGAQQLATQMDSSNLLPAERWLQLPTWSQDRGVLPATSDADFGGTWILFGGSRFAELLGTRLEDAGASVVTVMPDGSCEEPADQRTFEVHSLGAKARPFDVRDSESYRRLVRDAGAQGSQLRGVLHLWSPELIANGPCADAIEMSRDLGLLAYTRAARALALDLDGAQPRLAMTVTAGLFEVLGEPLGAPEQALQLGPVRVLGQELPNVLPQLVDVTAPDPGASHGDVSALVEALLNELRRGIHDLSRLEIGDPPVASAPVVALRAGHRWVESAQEVPMSEISVDEAPRSSALRDDGVYLVIGGLGNVGLELARVLAEACRPRLVLTRRRALPVRDDWPALLADEATDSALANNLRRLLELEELGAEIWTAAIDLAQEGEVERLLQAVESRWRAIDGVIHCGGALGSSTFVPVEEIDEASVEGQLQAKVRGSLALAAALEQRTVDFCCLTGSMAAHLGGLGFTAYAGANAFQDALARTQQAAGRKWLSIAWDGWDFGGGPGAGDHGVSLEPRRAARTFLRALELGGAPQALVVASDLESRRRLATSRRSPQHGGLDAANAEGPVSSVKLVAEGSSAEILEAKILAVWKELLGIESIAPQEDFFEIGGHSLLATQLASRLRRVLGISVPLRAIFEAPTARTLAHRLSSSGPGAAADRPAIRRREDGGPAPLSFAQQRFWFFEQMDSETAIYNIPTVLRLRGELGVAHLEAALSEVVRRHEALRTLFLDGADGPMQVVQPHGPLRLPVLDVASLPALRGESLARTLATIVGRRRFDLRRGPLMHLSLVRLTPRDHLLVTSLHHIICDGWSVEIFVREISAFYRARLRGVTPELPHLPVTYGDYAAWQRRDLAPTLEAQMAYWRRHLSGAETLQLPLDRPRSDTTTYRGATESEDYDLELTESLRALGQRHGATLFMVLLAAFKLLLHRHSGQDDIVVGTNVAGRDVAEVEDLIGCFINNLVLRTDLSGDPTFAELVERVQAVTLGAYTHQELPFEQVVDALQVRRRSDLHPLFQAALVLQVARQEELALGDVEVGFFEVEAQAAAFDLLFNLQEHAGGMSGTIEFNLDLFDRQTIRTLLSRFRHLLRQLVDDPQQPLSAFPLEVSGRGASAAGAQILEGFMDDLE